MKSVEKIADKIKRLEAAAMYRLLFKGDDAKVSKLVKKAAKLARLYPEAGTLAHRYA